MSKGEQEGKRDLIIQPVDWTDIRPIYKKLSEEFHVLTDAYALQLVGETKVKMDHLILAIDQVDKCIDEISSEGDRVAAMDFLIDYLKDKINGIEHPMFSPKLKAIMPTIKLIIHQEEIVDEFIKAVTDIFNYTEKKRYVKTNEALIELVSKEGIATARLPLSFMKVGLDEPFAKFFTQLCLLMGIMDLIVDARDDYKQQIISVKPNLGLYFSLFKKLCSGGFSALWQFPRTLKFIAYCTKFALVLIFEKD